MFQISIFFQISEASEEGSLEPNHELSKSDQDNINQKDNDEIDNIENSKEDLKTDDKDIDSDDDYVEMNQINPSREISSNTITNDNNETTKEESNEGVKEDEKTKDATTTTSKDISIQTDPNALSPNKYRYHLKKKNIFCFGNKNSTSVQYFFNLLIILLLQDTVLTWASRKVSNERWKAC